MSNHIYTLWERLAYPEVCLHAGIGIFFLAFCFALDPRPRNFWSSGLFGRWLGARAAEVPWQQQGGELARGAALSLLSLSWGSWRVRSFPLNKKESELSPASTTDTLSIYLQPLPPHPLPSSVPSTFFSSDTCLHPGCRCEFLV